MIDYSYDSLSRLIEADYNDGVNVYNYGYDVAGNMVNYDGVNRTYNAANQMVNDGTNTLTYDNNGNLTGNGTDIYIWDRANRLLSVGNHDYVYDGLGNRVQQTVSTVVTNYLNDIQPSLTKLLKQTTGANVEQFVHAPRGIHAVDDGTDWNFFLQDGLGSVRGLVDDMAVVQSSMSYDPYGNPSGAYGEGFGFTGEQTDENGSVFLRARYYEPQMVVFSALDQIEGKSCTPMSLNRYGYVHGNPIMMTDPSGMIAIDWDWSGTSAILNKMSAAVANVLTINKNPLAIGSINSGLCGGVGSPNYGSGGKSIRGGMPTKPPSLSGGIRSINDGLPTKNFDTSTTFASRDGGDVSQLICYFAPEICALTSNSISTDSITLSRGGAVTQAFNASVVISGGRWDSGCPDPNKCCETSLDVCNTTVWGGSHSLGTLSVNPGIGIWTHTHFGTPSSGGYDARNFGTPSENRDYLRNGSGDDWMQFQGLNGRLTIPLSTVNFDASYSSPLRYGSMLITSPHITESEINRIGVPVRANLDARAQITTGEIAYDSLFIQAVINGNPSNRPPQIYPTSATDRRNFLFYGRQLESDLVLNGETVFQFYDDVTSQGDSGGGIFKFENGSVTLIGTHQGTLAGKNFFAPIG